MEHENNHVSTIEAIVNGFVVRAREELDERLAKWKIDLSSDQVHEVVGGLLARQFVLADQLAKSPGVWTHHVAPLVLRAMAEVHISVAWILGDPSSRSQRFIAHGLGQAKLQLEHRRKDLESRDPLEGELEQMQAMEDWINAQRATFLTDVNLGSWSGLSSRQMAEEAQCLDFYNYVYSPFSACVHSMWNHIALHNLRTCDNPLHRFHRVPYAGDDTIDPHYLYLAAKYLDKTFRAFDGVIGIKIGGNSAFEELVKKLGTLTTSAAAQSESDDIVNSDDFDEAPTAT